jgi:hypothetical protein
MHAAGTFACTLHSSAFPVEVSSALHAAEVFDALIKKWPRDKHNLVYVNVDHDAFAHQQGSYCIIVHPAAARPFSFVADSADLPPGFKPLQQVRAL